MARRPPDRRYVPPQQSSAAPVTPITILGSAPAWWLDASAGTLVDSGAGKASSWSDSSGNARGFSFGVGVQQPTIALASLNGKTTCTFTAGSYGSNSYSSPAPGTTASYMWMIVRTAAVIGTARWLAFGQTSGASAIYNVAGPNDYNGSSGGAATIAVNTWCRLEVLRSNQGTDYVQINGVGSAANAGNSASPGGAGVTIAADFNGLNPNAFDAAECFQWHGVPTAPQRAALAAYALTKWGV